MSEQRLETVRKEIQKLQSKIAELKDRKAGRKKPLLAAVFVIALTFSCLHPFCHHETKGGEDMIQRTEESTIVATESSLGAKEIGTEWTDVFSWNVPDTEDIGEYFIQFFFQVTEAQGQLDYLHVKVTDTTPDPDVDYPHSSNYPTLYIRSTEKPSGTLQFKIPRNVRGHALKIKAHNTLIDNTLIADCSYNAWGETPHKHTGV